MTPYGVKYIIPIVNRQPSFGGLGLIQVAGSHRNPALRTHWDVGASGDAVGSIRGKRAIGRHSCRFTFAAWSAAIGGNFGQDPPPILGVCEGAEEDEEG